MSEVGAPGIGQADAAALLTVAPLVANVADAALSEFAIVGEFRPAAVAVEPLVAADATADVAADVAVATVGVRGAAGGRRCRGRRAALRGRGD